MLTNEPNGDSGCICGSREGPHVANLLGAILTLRNNRSTRSQFCRLVKDFEHLSTVCIGLTPFTVNARETSNAMFEPHESDLSYPLSLLHVKTRTLRFSSNLNPNQRTAVSVDFWSVVAFISNIILKLTEQALP